MIDFKKLKMWEKSYAFGLEIYKVTDSFPKSEVYGITSQLRRASISISTNIAEGCGKYTQKEFINFLQIALGSCYECTNLLMFSKDLKYIESSNFIHLDEQLNEIKKMITVYIKNTRNSLKSKI